jgi:hypothetical protein
MAGHGTGPRPVLPGRRTFAGSGTMSQTIACCNDEPAPDSIFDVRLGIGEPQRRAVRAAKAMSLQVQFLPARQGDAIWVRWPGHQLLIDLAPSKPAARSVSASAPFPRTSAASTCW